MSDFKHLIKTFHSKLKSMLKCLLTDCKFKKTVYTLQVRVTQNSQESGGEVEIRILQKGDFFGEKALEK